MDIDKIRLKFLNSSWEEIIEIINLRLGATQEEYLEDLRHLNTANEVVRNIVNQSSEDIERDENLLQFGIAETNAERDSRLEKQRKEREAREKAIEDEKKKNHAETGHLETNLERANREEKEEAQQENDLNLTNQAGSLSEELEKLKKLQESGVITQEEFEKAKNKLLNN